VKNITHTARKMIHKCRFLNAAGGSKIIESVSSGWSTSGGRVAGIVNKPLNHPLITCHPPQKFIY
jgi:hypothetical protein